MYISRSISMGYEKRHNDLAILACLLLNGRVSGEWARCQIADAKHQVASQATCHFQAGGLVNDEK